MTLHTGDCLDVMPTLAAGSVDAVVTDPPYDLTNRTPDVKACEECGRVLGGSDGRPLVCPRCGGQLSYQRSVQGRGFMGKAWDGTGIAFDPATWEAALRVARPGAYLLAFGGTRTVHRMTCAIEDAGWVIRDVLVWAYAQGFPKSRASLKPAWEPIVMARKPGASSPLQIDAARIGTTVETWPATRSYAVESMALSGHFPSETQATGDVPPGRWPANVVLTDPIFDGDVPGVVGGGAQRTNDVGAAPAEYGGSWSGSRTPFNHDLEGTYSRFFLIPKADRAEREPLLTPVGHDPATRFTTHPTIKPLDLMRHLVRLVTPPGGTVLDPFLGSGTTALACEMEGFPWIGIEREPEYVAIAEARLMGVQRGMGLVS